ncbi:MAG: DUF4270 family protein [Microscillaceae bacterium]|nr:DUF4270 family protein [Microscillaceae bacterium]
MSKKHLIIPFFFVGVILLSLVACNDSTQIGSSFNPDNSTEVIALDTFTLFTSTVKVDSLITSGSNRILVGSYLDDRLGKISSKSYFQIGIPAGVDVLESAVFDSISLVLSYNYYWGDTLATQNIAVHTLSEELAFEDDETALYNVSEFDYSAAPIATRSFLPRPNRGKALEIRLPNYLGATWLELAKDDSELLSDQEQFLDEFPGLVLVADTLNGACMLGFQANISTDDLGKTQGTYLRVYYHEQGDEKYLDFPLVNTNLQFNQIDYDSDNPTLAALSTQKSILSSEDTFRETYLQAGVGLMTRIEIPYVDKILELGNTSVTMYAELIIRPVNRSFDYLRLPAGFNTFESDAINRFRTQLDLSYQLSLDSEFDRSTYYKVDITDFILEDLDQDAIKNNVFLLTLPQFSNSTERLVLGGTRHPSNPMQLRVIVTRFY